MAMCRFSVGLDDGTPHMVIGDARYHLMVSKI